MWPFLFTVPGTDLRLLTMPVCLALAVATASVVTATLGRRYTGLDARSTMGAVVSIACLGLAGGRIHFMLAYPELYRDRPWAWLNLLEGGRHVPGVVLGLVLGVGVVSRIFRLPLLPLADCGAIGVAIGLAIARLGCLLHGCCFGIACQGWWCVTYPPSAPLYNLQLPQGLIPPGAVRSLPVHPLPLYFAGIALIVASLLRWRLPRKHHEGEVLLLGLVGLGTSSAVLEPFRFDHAARRYFLGVPQLQLLHVSLALAALLALLTVRTRRHRLR